MPTSAELRARIIENANEINRLHSRVKESFRRHSENDSRRQEWFDACEELRSKYNLLCIPGGFDPSFEHRLKAGDPDTVEVALCFLEVRPYFFRSGYMWKDLLRKCKHATKTAEQSARYTVVAERLEKWKIEKKLKAERGTKVRNDLRELLQRFDRLFPICLSDADLGGVRTIGDLYITICRAMKLEPMPSPDARSGRIRKPYSPGRKVRSLWFELLTSETHGLRTWSSADVWVTMVATIRDVYGLDASFEIRFDSIFVKLNQV